MKGLLARRPSPAMVVAIVALVVAMAGTGYAATQLPRNSVGTKQIKANAITTAKIKQNAVTGAKVADHSLTGDDIDLAKLGTVPTANAANTADVAKSADAAKSANTASVANTANALAPLEATRFVGTPGQPEFLNGATNAPDEPSVKYPDVGFYKDHDGIVHLTGVVETGGTGATIFILPVGFRPASGAVLFFNALCRAAGGVCDVDSEGDEEGYVQLLVAGSNAVIESTPVDGRVLIKPDVTVSLDGITFRAES